MINDLILRVTNNGVITDLDVDGAVPLRLDISQVDNQDIGEVYGVSSQNFNLPGTNKNNKFFNHGYLESAIDVPGLYNTIPCSVIRNGETLLQGTLQVNDIITSDSGFTTYDVTVSDKVVDFNEALKSKFLYEGNWTPYNHTLNSQNVIRSWNPRVDPTGGVYSNFANLVSGSVYYPYINYGFDDILSWPTYPAISAEPTTGSYWLQSGSTSYINTPLNLGQLYPAIGAREVFDVIFEQAGFSYSSSFIDSSDFDEVFVLTKNKEGLGVSVPPGSEPNLFSASAGPNYPDRVAVNGGSQRNFELIMSSSVYDPDSNFNATTGRYTAPIAGNYTWQVSVDFNNSANETDFDKRTGYQARSYIYKPGEPFGEQIFGEQTIFLAQGDPDPNNVNLEATAYLEEGYQIIGDFFVDNASATVATNPTEILSSSFLKVISAPIDYQDTAVDMSLQIDSSIKSIDMFKGLLTQFNLVAYPLQQDSSVIAIETFDTWMRNGEVKDWTEKFNSAKRTSIKNPVVEQPREIKFQNVEDEDRISKLTQDSTPNFQYGTLRTISDSNLTSGELDVESLFAPTVLAPVVSLTTSSFSPEQFTLAFNNTRATNFIQPHLYKFDNSEMKSFKFKPRIGYRSAYVNDGFFFTGTSTYPVAESGNLQAPQLQYMQSGSGGTYNVLDFYNYSTLTNYKNYPVTSSTEDLLFNSSYDKLSTSTTLYPSSGSSAFNSYWKTYIDSLYDADSRKVTLDLFFEEYEYQDIKLNDKIIIGDNAYRINKIKGFNLTRRDIVTVELLTLFPSYYPIIETGPFECPSVQTNAPTNVLTSQFTANGEVISYGTDGVGSYVDTGFLLSFIGATDPVIGDANTFTYWSGNTPAPGVNFNHVFAGLSANTNYSYRAMISSSNDLCDRYIYGDTEFLTTQTGSGCDDTVSASYDSITTSSFNMNGTITQVGSAETFVRGFVYSSGSDTNPIIGGTGVTRIDTGSAYGAYNSTVTGADCGTNYYFKAFQSQSGCIIYSDLNSLTTTACPSTGSCLAFNASSPTNFSNACSETIDQVLYTDYSGSWPPTQAYLDGGGVMTVYTSAGCAVASPNTYYAFDSSSRTGTDNNSFLRVDDGVGDGPGDVISIFDCTGP